MGIIKSQFFDLVAKYDYLISPEQVLYEFMHRDKYTEETNALIQFIKKQLLSEAISNVYNPNNFFLGFADCFAEKKGGSVYLIEFDIKGCTKLINKISSKEIYSIKAFIFNYLMKYLRYKTQSSQIYSFDYSKNDDGFVIINTGLDINVIRTYLIEAANFITNAIAKSFPQLDYSKFCAFGFSIVILGRGRSLPQLYASFEDKTNVRLDIVPTETMDYKTKYFIAEYDNQPDTPYSENPKTTAFLQTIESFNDDFGGPYCKPEHHMYHDFGNSTKCAINIKFNNFSGLNNLTGNKIYSHLLFQNIVACIHKSLKHLDANIYFIGLNSCIVTMPETDFDPQIIANIKKHIDTDINRKKVFNFFDKRIPLVDTKQRFKDIVSKKGYDNGISISNIAKISMNDIRNKKDLLNFKIKSYCGE